MSLILRKYKYNDDNEAALMRLAHQLTHTAEQPEQTIIPR